MSGRIVMAFSWKIREISGKLLSTSGTFEKCQGNISDFLAIAGLTTDPVKMMIYGSFDILRYRFCDMDFPAFRFVKKVEMKTV